MHKTLSKVQYWGRFLIVLLTAYLLQQTQLGDVLLSMSPSLNMSSIQLVATVLLVLYFGHSSVYLGMSRIWNRITPVKDRATHIENEVVFCLSTFVGSLIFFKIFLLVPSPSFSLLALWIALSILPAMGFGWILSRLMENLSPHIADIKPEDIIELKETGFWKRRLAYVGAAVVFHLAFAFVMVSLLWIQTGSISNWVSAITACGIVTLIILVCFGHLIVGLGHWFIRNIKVNLSNRKTEFMLAYALGFMLIMFVAASLCLVPAFFQNQALLATWWAYLIAFGLISLCALLAGWFFSAFYTEPSVNAAA